MRLPIMRNRRYRTPPMKRSVNAIVTRVRTVCYRRRFLLGRARVRAKNKIKITRGKKSSLLKNK